jgi:hypothetical protein
MQGVKLVLVRISVKTCFIWEMFISTSAETSKYFAALCRNRRIEMTAREYAVDDFIHNLFSHH